MLEGVKRKYPQVNLEDLLTNAKTASAYSNSFINFQLQFGGQQSGRSVVKSALALAVDSGIESERCEQALAYLQHEDGEPCFGYYYEKDLLTLRPKGAVIHCVAVQGISSTQLLLAYVELFGIQRMLVVLSRAYVGADFMKCYALDPVVGKELELGVNLDMPYEEIIATFNYQRIPDGSIAKVCDAVMPIAMRNAFDIERQRVVEEATKYAMQNCGVPTGGVLLTEHVNRITELMMEKLTPFIVHQMGLGRRLPDTGIPTPPTKS